MCVKSLTWGVDFFLLEISADMQGSPLVHEICKILSLLVRGIC